MATVYTAPVPYDVLLDEDGSGYTYVGKATPGSLESDDVWLISRIDETGAPDLEVKYADGAATFNKIWDNRASYVY